MLYRIEFDRLQIVSDITDTNTAPDARRLRFDGTGKVRFRVDDNILGLSATANIKEFRGYGDVAFKADDVGMWFTYNVVIDRLKGNVHNMPEWMDHRISDSLRRSLSRSINHQRKKDRMADMRMPLWIPVDAAVDIELTARRGATNAVADVAVEDVK
jgi:hypothetical protein